MQIGDIASFALLCLVLSISPGPDSLLVIKLALERRILGFLAAAGSAIGSIAWAALVAVGVANFLAHNSSATTVLHVAGGLYLIYLGTREFLHRDDADLDIDSSTSSIRDLPAARAFTQGLISCILNPKVGLFFLLIAPQYAAPLTAKAVLSLGVIDAAVAFAWLGLLAVGASFMAKQLTDATLRRRIFQTMGLIITAIGLYVVASAFA